MLSSLRDAPLPACLQADGGGSAVDSFSVMSGPVQPAETIIRPRFFKNVIPDIAIATCASCNRWAWDGGVGMEL